MTNKRQRARKTQAEIEAERAAARERKILLEQRRTLVDEYGRLDRELLPIKAKLRRLEDLSRLIRSWENNSNPEGTTTAEGKLYEVIIGPKGMQTRLASTGELYRVMGHDKFLAAASITVKALESAVDAGTVASLCTKERTGIRSLLARKRSAA